jgi:prevent-host-death family protein
MTPVGWAWMMKVNVYEAKTHFSGLLRRVALGEEITITKRGAPVARLVPVPTESAKRKLGFFRGRMTVPDDFDAPLPADILDAFERKPQSKSSKKYSAGNKSAARGMRSGR